MAVLGSDGAVMAASAGFAALELRNETAQALIAAAARHPDRLVKRPISTGRGTLPAAIGRISDDMHLLFAVETILGRLDPMEDEAFPAVAAPVASVAAMPEAEANLAVLPETPEPLAEPAIAVRPQDHLQADIDDLPGSDEDPSLPTAAPEAGEEPVAAAEEAVDDAAEEPVSAPAANDGITFTPADTMAVDIDDLPGSDEDPALLTCPPETGEEPVATAAPAGEAHDPDTIAHAADGHVVAAAPQRADDAAPSAPTETVADVADVSDVQVIAETETTDEADGETSAEAGLAHAAPVEAPLPASSGPVVAEPDAAPDFEFQRGGRAVRFVWKIDADGHFSEVSDEFAQTVGPRAGDVIGKSFASLAERFHLDPDGVITGLLQRRDTWSGKTVLWPVEGTSLKVPVDLAALPTYSRARSFDGFRGFGIVRVSDVVEDADATGLALLPAAQAVDVAEAPVEDEPVLDTSASDAAVGEPQAPDVPEAAGDDTPTGETPEDPFQGEQPALQTSAAESLLGANVIPLSSLRQPVREPLTRGEQAAFREIARRLGDTIGPANEADSAAAAAAETQTPATGAGRGDRCGPARHGRARRRSFGCGTAGWAGGRCRLDACRDRR